MHDDGQSSRIQRTRWPVSLIISNNNAELQEIQNKFLRETDQPLKMTAPNYVTKVAIVGVSEVAKNVKSAFLLNFISAGYW